MDMTRTIFMYIHTCRDIDILIQLKWPEANKWRTSHQISYWTLHRVADNLQAGISWKNWLRFESNFTYYFFKFLDGFLCQKINIASDNRSQAIICTNVDQDLWCPMVSPGYNEYRFSAHMVPDSKVHGPTWGPPGSCRPQMGPMLAPWTLLSGVSLGPKESLNISVHCSKNITYAKYLMCVA